MPVLEGALLLEGPGRVTVRRGELEVLGAVVPEGDSIVVPAGRRVPALARSPVEAEHSLASVTPLPRGWYERVDNLASRIASEGERVMLVGPSDAGKSTLAAWIANKWAGGATLLTVDVGQNEVFCPGFASAAPVKPPVIPGAVDAGSVSSCFVGSFTPRQAVDRYIYCAGRLAGSGRLVVDTDGWVARWDGLASKAAVAAVAGADLIVAVDLGEREAAVLERLSGARVERITRLVESTKSREERRVHRERLLAKWIAGAPETSYKADKVPVIGAPVFNGDPVDPRLASDLLGVRVVYAERVGGEIVAVVRGRARRSPGARLVREGWEKGRIAAVHAAGAVWPGIITRVNYRSREITVLTRAGPEAELVEVGSASVDASAYSGSAKW